MLIVCYGEFGLDDVDVEVVLFLDCDMVILVVLELVFSVYDCGVVEEYKGVVLGFLYCVGCCCFL